jgi:hypothetical protein
MMTSVGHCNEGLYHENLSQTLLFKTFFKNTLKFQLDIVNGTACFFTF